MSKCKMDGNNIVYKDVGDTKGNFITNQKKIENEGEIVAILQESLSQNMNQIMILKENLNAVKKERDSKITEIQHLKKIVNIQERTIKEYRRDRAQDNETRAAHSLNSLSQKNYKHSEYEGENYKHEIESLIFDLNVMEDLYKICNEEVIKQEEIINSLRQANLDNQGEILDLKVENEMILSRMTPQIELHKCKHCLSRSKSIDKLDNELLDIKSKLIYLENILIAGENVDAEKLSSNIAIKFERDILNRNKETFGGEKKVEHIINSNAECKYKMPSKRSKRLNLKKAKDVASRNKKKIRSEDEISSLRCEINELRDRISSSNEKYSKLEAELEDERESFKKLQRRYEDKVDSADWLEARLAESTAKGSEMCNVSRQVCEYVRALMKKTKEEKKVLSKKIAVLQNVNEYVCGDRRSTLIIRDPLVTRGGPS